MGSSPRVAVVSGRLAPFAAGFGCWLTARGYSPWTVGDRLEQFGQVSRWLGDQGLGVQELEFGAGRAVLGGATRCWLRDVRFVAELGVAA
jgi:hypothetical protein